MYKEKVMYRHGTFKDYEGNNRPFCFAAVSLEPEVPNITYEDDDYYAALPKKLFIGVSVCHSADIAKYSTELAETIAKGKALNHRSVHGALYTTTKGYINTKVVKALLEQESEYFIQNPGSYIAGYNRNKKVYQDAKKNEVQKVSTES